MYGFRLAIATYCLPQPFHACVRIAAELGIQGVQCDVRHEIQYDRLTETGRRDLLHLISEHGLAIGSASFPLNHGLIDPHRLDERVAAIRTVLKFAYSLKSTTLCLRVGRIPDDASSREYRLLVEILNDLASYSNHIGTVLAIAALNESPDPLRRLLGQVTTGPMGVDFDPAHFAMAGCSPTEALQQFPQQLLHVQLRDGVSGMKGGQETAVGRGSVDWVEILALLSEMGYRGWLTAIRTQGTERQRDLTRAITVMQKLLTGQSS